MQLKSSRSGPKFARQSIHCILRPHPRSRRPTPPAVTPGAPIGSPKGRKTLPKSTVFPKLGFTQFESSCSGPKFARQSIHRILGPHPHPRRPSSPAVTPGAPSDPQKDRKHPPNQLFPIARFHAISQVVAAQNLPDNQSTTSLGLIHVPGGHLPQP